MRETCRGRTGNPSLGVDLRCTRLGEALLDSLHYLLNIGRMLPWDRLMAGATEVAEEVGIGVDWGGCAERYANTSEQSDDEPQALADRVHRTHKHPSVEDVTGLVALTTRCVGAPNITVDSVTGCAPQDDRSMMDANTTPVGYRCQCCGAARCQRSYLRRQPLESLSDGE